MEEMDTHENTHKNTHENTHTTKTSVITAKHINDCSGTKRIERKRRRRLIRDEPTQEAYKAISSKEASLTNATTSTEVETAQQIRRNYKDAIQGFENSAPRQKDIQTKDLKTQRTLSCLASAERKIIHDHGKGMKCRQYHPCHNVHVLFHSVLICVSTLDPPPPNFRPQYRPRTDGAISAIATTFLDPAATSNFSIRSNVREQTQTL
jgi:hypothetical protein